MTGELPEITSLASESSSEASYDNHPIARVNDHVVRISVMTQPYPWHFHPNSDETFLVIEGRLNIEFEDGTLELGPGQKVTPTPSWVDQCRGLTSDDGARCPAGWSPFQMQQREHAIGRYSERARSCQTTMTK